MPAKKSTTSKPVAKKSRASTNPKTATKKAASKRASPKKRSTKRKLNSKQTKAAASKDKVSLLPIQVRNRMSILVLSPYRFPVDAERLAIQSARLAGLAFVFIGALLAAFHLPGAADHIANSVQSEHMLAQSYDTTSVSVDNAAEVFTVDQALIGAESAIASASDGSARLELVVNSGNDYVSYVSFSYYDSDLNEEVLIRKIANTQNGTYEHFISASHLSQVEFPIEISVLLVDDQYLSRGVWKLDLSTDEIDEVKEPYIVFSAEYLPEKNQVNVSIDTDKADKVIVYGTETRSGVGFSLGEATETSVGLWEFEWSPTTSGSEYELFAKVLLDESTFESERQTVYLDLIDNNSSDAATNDSEDFATVSTSTSASTSVDSTGDTLRASDVAEIVTDIESKVIEPSINLSNGSEVTETEIIKVTTYNTSYVELYVLSETQSNPRLLGKASPVSDSRYEYRWDTTTLANGVYTLFATAGIGGTSVSGSKVKVWVHNDDAEITEEPIKEAVTTKASDPEVAVGDTSESEIEIQRIEDKSKVQDIVIESEAVDEAIVSQSATDLLREYSVDLELALAALADAVRTQNQSAVELAKTDLQALRQRIITNTTLTDVSGPIAQIDQALEERIAKLQDNVQTTERIIQERTGEVIHVDSDGDGVSDYDEKNLYYTNPMSDDTDEDGVSDADELIDGSSPVDAAPEARLAYESAKEYGIVRDDILKVNDITTVTKTIDEANTVSNAKAVIKGSALPNSFVTLFIYSTPTIVTVKTDADGSWTYEFDKELEDGEHEVYVGVTDNAGRIVAKSQPLRFVKTAEAFSPVASVAPDSVVTQTPSTSVSLFTDKMILLVASISIIIIGLILLLLGQHLHANRRENFVADESLVPAT